jgi:hypothetical protein
MKISIRFSVHIPGHIWPSVHWYCTVFVNFVRRLLGKFGFEPAGGGVENVNRSIELVSELIPCHFQTSEPCRVSTKSSSNFMNSTVKAIDVLVPD